MRAHLGKFFSYYFWTLYILWVIYLPFANRVMMSPFDWCMMPIAVLFGIYQLSEAKMDLDLRHLQDIDQGRA